MNTYLIMSVDLKCGKDNGLLPIVGLTETKLEPYESILGDEALLIIVQVSHQFELRYQLSR